MSSFLCSSSFALSVYAYTPSLHTTGPTMEPDQPPSTPSTHPSDPLHSLRPPSTDRRPFQDNRSDERLLDHSAPSQGTSMWPGIFQGNYLLDTPFQSSIHHALPGSAPGMNQATPTL